MNKKWQNEDGTFEKLSDDQFNELTDAEKSAYTIDLIKNSAEKSVADFIENKNLATNEQIDELKNIVASFKEEINLKEINLKLEALNDIVKGVGTQAKEAVIETVQHQIVKQAKDLDKSGKDGKIQVKTATTIATAISDRTWNHQLRGVSRTASPKFVMTHFFPVIYVSDPNSFDELSYVDWDEASITRAAAARAENAAVAESDLAMIEKTVTLKSIADSVTLTRAAQRRADIFARDINMFLEDNMKRLENQALYNGDGTGNNISGIYTQVDAFNHAGYSGKTIQNANLSDLALILKKEIMNGADGANGYNVDFAFVTWDDYIDLTGGLKSADDQYILPPLHGIQFIPTSFVATNTMLIGDSTKAKIYKTLNYDYEVGYKSGNWEKRMPSVLVETVLAMLVREADKAAFLKVTSVSAAKTAITT